MNASCWYYILWSVIFSTSYGALTSAPTPVAGNQNTDWRSVALRKVEQIEKELDENERACIYLKKTAEAIRTAEFQGAREMVRRAAFDIGSGATKVQVADVKLHVGAFPVPDKAVYSEKKNILLTEDLERSSDGSFSPAVLDELARVLTAFKAKAAAAGAEQFAGVATAAFRKAANGPDFLRRMEGELGIRLRIVAQVAPGAVSHREFERRAAREHKRGPSSARAHTHTHKSTRTHAGARRTHVYA